MTAIQTKKIASQNRSLIEDSPKDEIKGTPAPTETGLVTQFGFVKKHFFGELKRLETRAATLFQRDHGENAPVHKEIKPKTTKELVLPQVPDRRGELVFREKVQFKPFETRPAPVQKGVK